MEINKIQIENFRSLSSIEFKMENYLVVFGKNNEGKSNILKAIKRHDDIVKKILNFRIYTKKDGIKLNRHNFSNPGMIQNNFKIENDIPIEIKEVKRTTKVTKICLVYKLKDDEVELLNSLLKSTSKATNYLEVMITYDRDLRCKVSIRLREGGRALSVLKNMYIILEFLQNNYSIDYIPSVRTENHTVNIIENTISEKLNQLEESDEYMDAINKINELQREVLNNLSTAITPDMKKYINSIDTVEIISSEKRLRKIIRNNYSIIIDDGKRTDIADKGDGIKSLIALSLLQERNSKNGLLMIDEPEAHLHSAAIKELESRIKNEANNQQVLIASHHQIFVDRNHISRNIILSSGKIKNKINIRDIRKELGVGLGENLLNAELVIIFEGESDRQFFMNYIQKKDESINKLIRGNKIIIDISRGTKNLESILRFYSSTFCKCMCILDNDDASNKVVKNIIETGILEPKYIYKTPLRDKKETELEDLYDEKFIFDSVDEFFGISNSIDKKNCRKNERMTVRLKNILDIYGKDFKAEEEKFKFFLVEQSKNSSDLSFISEEAQYFLDSMVETIHKNYFN